jgi:uncharacterized protein YqeY
MSLKETLQNDLTTAMKARDELTAATVRMVLTAITNEEVSGKSARVLTDAEVVTVLGREAKKRREAAEAFEQGGRADRAERERQEGAVIERYLPQQLTSEELASIIATTIAEVGATSPQQLGLVMKSLQPKVAGRADGAAVAAAVRGALGA